MGGTYALLAYTGKQGNRTQGAAGHYLKIESLPGRHNEGKGDCIIGNEYAVTFLFTPARSGSSFDAWYEHDPQNRFVLTPTIEMFSDGNTASGFDMTFNSDPKLGNFVAHYMRTNEADPNSETPKAL